MALPFIADAVSGITKLASKFIKDKDAQIAFEHDFKMAAINGELSRDLQNISVNLSDSKSDHFIQYAWRPFIGWVCGWSLAYSFVFQPFINWVAFMSGYDLQGMPTLDTSALTTVLLGLLGLGAARTVEKVAKTKKG